MTPPRRRILAGLAGAAAGIAVVTALSRVIGFGRNYVLAHSIGTDCLNTAYNTANYVPNILFELVAGGALAGAVVPLLAGHAADGGPQAREHMSRVTSALLGWVLVVLVPLSLLVAVLAVPIMAALAAGPGSGPACDAGDVVEVGARMLVVFAPRTIFFGLAVVLYGVLQAHRRYLAPALAPLVSSLMIIVVYLAFVPMAHGAQKDLTALTRPAELVLSVGTTLAAVAMVAVVAGPFARLGLRIRPTLRFPEGVAGRARRLAGAGLVLVVMQQLAMLVVIPLANAHGPGMIGAYGYAWAVFQLPYAVLAVPIATSAFTALSAHRARGEDEAFDDVAARTTRAVLLVTGGAAGVLAAVATPVARVFLLDTDTAVAPETLARGIALFAPGLAGYALLTHLGRVLYAHGRTRPVALAGVTGWTVVIAAQVALALNSSAPWVVGMLGLASTAGLTLAALLLTAVVARTRGPAALRGLPRTAAAAVLGGLAAYAAGAAVVHALGRDAGKLASLGVGLLAAVAATAAFALIAYALSSRDLRALLPRARA
ncbi:murein biosynthesis integral membrane protein MurJ [Bailinhaonella thermotolerans]|uniref:Virulence factor MviN n=1 Tax=Bailinhaonella thermotolerans TaxID=1070861 RepID=A0A3A3ZYT7_9ACTN|nr:lipid II flippase MurJ [Bailinhaonella thermotolerans]RJL20675.1 virulence factor MviN [Bailinhaonella thermotolerans]